MYRHVRVLTRTGIAVATAGALALTTAPGATAADLSYSAGTWVGVHNSYDKAKYTYFADALDSGAGMLELDVWTNVFGASWRVSHSNPIGNDNNCENAANAGELRTRSRNRDLAGCLSDIKAWHDAHPGHRPIQLKIEMKDGFQANNGRGPAQLDALLTAKLGDALLRPADVVGSHSDLDSAVRADGWPARSALAGKFMVELIPGTVEEGNPSTRSGRTASTPRTSVTSPRPGACARRPLSPPCTTRRRATRAPATRTRRSAPGS